MQPIFAEFIDDDTRLQVCLADCPDYLDYSALADILYGVHGSGLEQTDVLLVRPRVDQPLSIEKANASDVGPLVKRAPHASIHILYSADFEIAISSNLNTVVNDRLPSASHRKRILEWLSDKELYTYMKNSTALFRAKPTFVYRAPSQRFVNMFLRVGSIQRTRQVLDGVFFWMLPHLKLRTAILSDTWSISSIALNAARFVERYWARLSVNERPTQSTCRVDMLSAYPDDLLLVLPETREALHRVTEAGQRKVLVVLSAVASGYSFTKLRTAINRAQYRPEEFSFLALYRLSPTEDLPFLCDLSSGVSGNRFESVPKEKLGARTVIEIDRSTYFPLHIKETPLLIGKVHATPSYEVFSEYSKLEAFSVHRNAVDLSNQEHRHHGVYVDVTKMLPTSLFQAKLEEHILGVGRSPALIIVPPHRAGKLLAEGVATLFEQSYGRRPPIFMHSDLRLSVADMPPSLSNCGTADVIVVVDDVSVTGQRLARYQQSLRELNYPGQLVYLVGVARPDSEKNWERRIQQLSYRANNAEKHQVRCVERLILPDWDRSTCPWCLETQALSQMISQGSLDGDCSTLVAQRIMELERARIGAGLVNDVFWRTAECQSLALTENSIFMSAQGAQPSEADVLAAVASALQHMRITKDENQRLEASYPHVSLLNDDNYFADRFNDDVLRLAILRCAQAAELERVDGTAEERRRKSVRSFLLRRENQVTFGLELAVARLGQKIPQPSLSTDDWKGIPPVPAALWQSFSQFFPDRE